MKQRYRRQQRGAASVAPWIGCALVLLAGVAPLVRAAPGPLFVSPMGSGTACTQAAPCALHTALNLAADADLIYLAAGTYTATGDEVAAVDTEVSLWGGWDGAGTGPITRDPNLHTTILDGEGARRVITIAPGASPTLDGLYLTRGYTTGNGGAVAAMGGRPTVRGCWIDDNHAALSGGGVYFNNTTGATLLDNQIHDNGAATFSGGGIYVRNDPAVTVSRNTVERNTANGGGGGMHLDNCDAAGVTANAVLFNVSATYGGGIYLSGTDSARLVSNQIESNQAGAQGGGLYLNQSSGASVEQNLIAWNGAEGSGGGVSLFSESVDVSLGGNQIVDNWTDGDGAGVYVSDSGTSLFLNNLIAGNRLRTSGRNGAGLYAAGTRVELLHTTVAHNTGGHAQGVCLQDGATATLTNTILVSHSVGIQADAGSAVTMEATLWGAGVWANGTDTAGGGTILTGTVNVRAVPGFVDAATRDYHLAAGSAALDAGVDAGVRVDLDRQPRPYLAPDLGADEYWPAGALVRVYLPVVQNRMD